MDYPNNFDVPSFSAGKTVAFSRGISVWISIVFFLIIAACGFILLGLHLKKNYPFLISVDPYTDEWTVVAYPREQKETVQQYQVIQEIFVKEYVKNWFTISGNNEINEMRWNMCNIEKCSEAIQFKPNNINCAIACKSSKKLVEYFEDNILPEYQARVEKGHETWTVDGMLITPQNKLNEKSGTWQVIANITSSISGPFTVLSFIEIKRDTDAYPATFGYYVQDFNSYRIANE